jgi:hypothetical protein
MHEKGTPKLPARNSSKLTISLNPFAFGQRRGG